MFKELRRDVAPSGSPSIRQWLSALTRISFYLLLAYRFSAAARRWPLGRVFIVFSNFFARLFSGCYISERAQIAGGLKMPHPTGIVIGEDVRVGSDVTIYQNVTLGSSDRGAGSYPTIGDNVIIFANAVIVGRVNIGEGARIGAGAVVLKDVPAHATAVGNPARVLPAKRPD